MLWESGLVGQVGGTPWAMAFPHLSNVQCKVPGRKMLEGVICPWGQSEEMAHVPISFAPGERRLEKRQQLEEQGG